MGRVASLCDVGFSPGYRRHQPAVIPGVPDDRPAILDPLFDDDWFSVNRHGLT